MTKKKTSKEPKFSLNDMPIVKSKKNAPSVIHKSSRFFKSHSKVAAALLESLEQNDADAFLEILDAYLSVNKAQIARDAKLSRTTVHKVFSKKGNPTIRTIAKIVHKAVA
jgi:DNA-binding phage protein